MLKNFIYVIVKLVHAMYRGKSNSYKEYGIWWLLLLPMLLFSLGILMPVLMMLVRQFNMDADLIRIVGYGFAFLQYFLFGFLFFWNERWVKIYEEVNEESEESQKKRENKIIKVVLGTLILSVLLYTVYFQLL